MTILAMALATAIATTARGERADVIKLFVRCDAR